MNYYDLKITGKDVKRFINSLRKEHINFYKIDYIDNSVIIRVNKIDYLKIKKIKTIYEIEIIKYIGLAKYKYYLFKYKVFLIILFIGFIFFLVLTNLIFEVEVNTNNHELKELVLDELARNNLKKYKLVVSYKKKEEIKSNLLKKYNDKIEWLEIKRIGTKYLIVLEERKKNDSISDETPRNVVAKKNGIITKITSTSGEIVAKVDQYVKKGDVLISGNIHKKDDIVASTKASGKVLAETWYTVTVELPSFYYEEKKTGRYNHVLNLKFLNHNYYLFSKKFSDYTSKPLFSLYSSFLPISISFSKLEENNVTEGVYTQENAYFKASEIASNRLLKNLGKDSSIIFEKKLKTTENNSKIIIVMFYKVIEDITDYSDIETLEENNEEIR